jgi:HprK-related kinase A
MNRRLVAEVSLGELQGCLKQSGIFLSIPPFVVHLRSSIPVVAHGVHDLYAHHEFWLDGGDFVDFRIAVNPRRRFLKPLCEFEFDGRTPFTPLAYQEAFAFMEWGLNWCVSSHCHDWISIHAAVLERGGRALILPAPPGSGKSTLCAALMFHGWRLMSDEMTLLDPQTGLVTASPRPISLKNASIDILRRREPDAVMGPIAHDTLKGTVCHLRATRDSVQRAAEPAMPAWVVFPRYEAGAALSLERRAPAQGLMELQRNSFNRHVHGHAGFHALADLVDHCQIHDLRYSQLDEALACFGNLSVGP